MKAIHHSQEMLAMLLLRLHHTFSIHLVLQLANCLNKDAILTLIHCLLTDLQISASGRAAPVFTILPAGVLRAHITYFLLHLHGSYRQRSRMRKSTFFCNLLQFLILHKFSFRFYSKLNSSTNTS